MIWGIAVVHGTTVRSIEYSQRCIHRTLIIQYRLALSNCLAFAEITVLVIEILVMVAH